MNLGNAPNAGDGFHWTGALWSPASVWKSRGAYSGGTAYIPGDTVTYTGGTYLCTTATTGNLPTDASKWTQVASGNPNAGISPVNYLINATNTTGSQTSGVQFAPLQSGNILGVRLFVNSVFTSKTVKCSLWDVAGTSRMTFVNVTTDASIAGNGKVYTGTFSSAQAVTAFKKYIVSFWYADGSGYSYQSTSGLPYTERVYPAIANQFYEILSLKSWANGDAYPTNTASTEHYPIEPIFAAA